MTIDLGTPVGTKWDPLEWHLALELIEKKLQGVGWETSRDKRLDGQIFGSGHFYFDPKAIGGDLQDYIDFLSAGNDLLTQILARCPSCPPKVLDYLSSEPTKRSGNEYWIVVNPNTPTSALKNVLLSYAYTERSELRSYNPAHFSNVRSAILSHPNLTDELYILVKFLGMSL